MLAGMDLSYGANLSRAVALETFSRILRVPAGVGGALVQSLLAAGALWPVLLLRAPACATPWRTAQEKAKVRRASRRRVELWCSEQFSGGRARRPRREKRAPIWRGADA